MMAALGVHAVSTTRDAEHLPVWKPHRENPDLGAGRSRNGGTDGGRQSSRMGTRLGLGMVTSALEALNGMLLLLNTAFLFATIQRGLVAPRQQPSSEAVGELASGRRRLVALLSKIRRVSRLEPVGCRPDEPREERSRGV
jgi:hypothetical protein